MSAPSYIERRHALRDAAYTRGTTTCKAEDVVTWIYAVLTTLDQKASALMRLNGVLIAAAAFLLGLFGRTGESILSRTNFDAVLIIVCALLSAVSITLCLIVVSVSWNFLGKVKLTDGKYDFSDEIESLDKACTDRQRAYRAAWNISLLASVGFLAEFIWQTVYVIYCSFWR